MTLRLLILRTIAVLGALLSLASNIDAATHFVRMSNFTFTPSVTTVAVGDTVIWTNAGGSHTVTGTASDPFCGSSIVTTCTRTFNQAGSFRYVCNPHVSFNMTGVVVVAAAPNTPPTVAITNPSAATLLGASGSIVLGAAANDANGSVTNVVFMTNGVAAGADATVPYSLQMSNMAAGLYSITAAAADNAGARATSAPVVVRVVPPPHLQVVSATGSTLRFSYNTVTGVSYVIESSGLLTNFTRVTTNAGTGGAQDYVSPPDINGNGFFRVRVQP